MAFCIYRRWINTFTDNPNVPWKPPSCRRLPVRALSRRFDAIGMQSVHLSYLSRMTCNASSYILIISFNTCYVFLVTRQVLQRSLIVQTLCERSTLFFHTFHLFFQCCGSFFCNEFRNLATLNLSPEN